MKTLPPPISDAERAVAGFKHELLIRVQGEIVRAAMRRQYVSPGDISPDIVPDDSHQGVLSNAWSGLYALEIIDRLPMDFTDADKGIFAGRIQNKQPGAKGRWTACYKLKSAALARCWLERNGQAAPEKQGVFL